MSILHEHYKSDIVPALMKELKFKSVMEVPKITKITLNMGVGEAVADKKVIQNAVSDLQKISSQKPVITIARKSIAGFKIRDDMPIGCKVTLRNERMYDFLQRLISIAIPRIRDFRGVPAKAFDGKGNYSMGIDDQLIFPEVNPDKVKRTQGMNIAIVTTAVNDDAGKALLREFGMPFTK